MTPRGSTGLLLLAASALLLYAVSYVDGIIMFYGFIVMMFTFPFPEIVSKIAWFLFPSLPGLAGLWLLLNRNRELTA